MCGITGLVGNKSNLFIESMTNRIKHRGPDDSGIWHSDRISLGHRRLSIQDLSINGHQPMFSNDGRFVIIFNGEIYNHREIRHGLEKKYTFISSSDTETLLYAFIEYGTDVLEMLNGIFAFAIYDSETQNLWLVRDHFGVKPLYYYQVDGDFLFASELKSFLDFDTLNLDLDYKSLLSYIQLLWSPGERTAFENVRKVEPGHYIKINTQYPENFEIIKYYEIPFSGTYDNFSEKKWIELLETKLLEAVERQMLSDVPIGAFLSGGLDSSLIVAMSRVVNGVNPMTCFTIDSAMDSRFEGFADDLPYAIKVAKYLGVNLEIVEGRFGSKDDFDNMIWHLDEPQGDVAALNVWNICKRSRELGIVVLLSGSGGDDIFSGYRRHQSLKFYNYLKVIPPSLKGSIANYSKRFSSTSSFFRRVNKILSLSNHKTIEESMVELFTWLPFEMAQGLLTEEAVLSLNGFKPVDVLLDSIFKIPNERSTLNKMLFWELKYFLADHNLNYTDKMSMAHGVEVRVPFLDKELVDFSSRIPPDLKLKGLTTKYLLKKVGEKYLPKEIVYRSKTGFGAPVREWVRTDLKSLIDQSLSPNRLKELKIFNPDNVQKLIDENASGKIDASYSILALLAIESWLRQYKNI